MMAVNLLNFCSVFMFAATPQRIEFERQRLEAEHDLLIAVCEVEHPILAGKRCTRITWMEDDMAKTPVGPREARLRELREARVDRNKKVIDRKVKPAGKTKGKKGRA
jgi:hypothetical protein